MKKLIALSFTMIFIAGLFGQSGTVIYNETRKMNLKVDGIDDRIKNMLPSFNKKIKELLFNSSESIYKDVSEDEQHEMEEETMEGTVKLKMKIQASKDQTYINMKEKQKIDQRDLFGKTFLISESMPEKKWKILNDRKEILGYQCMKASITDGEDETVAWFTPEITIATGPGEFYGLPGLILEIDKNKGEVICTAQKIVMAEKLEIKKPKDGKKVSQKEFDEIQEKKMKEMKEMYGKQSKDGKSFIIINN